MTGKTALVVDDSKSARFALRKSLESQRYIVATVGGAEEAFQYLSEQRPEVIFLDHLMPGTDGFGVLDQLKADPALAAIPVVICSSNEAKGFTEQARARGAAAVMMKPSTPSELERILQSVMSAEPAPTAEALKLAEPTPATASAPAARPSAKVSPIREAEAIKEAVASAVRTALPSQPGPRGAATLSAVARAQPLPSEQENSDLREQMETRLRKITQDLYVELGELKARVAHVDHDSAGKGPAVSATEFGLMRAELQTLRGQLDALMDDVGRRLDETLAAARQAAAEEAQLVAERTVTNAASRISSQLAEGILKVMMGGKG